MSLYMFICQLGIESGITRNNLAILEPSSWMMDDEIRKQGL